MTSLKRKALSLQEKMKILQVFDEKSQTKNQTQLASELRLPVSTLRTIIKNRQEIEEKCKSGCVDRKKQRSGKFGKLENILVEWLHVTQSSNLPINGPIISEKARAIAKSLQIKDFNASNGWLDRFKNRHGIVYSQNRGKSDGAVQDNGDTWIKILSELLQNYEPRNIFNAEKFSLFFTLMADESEVFKDETCHGGKISKDKLTILACTNSDGSEKVRLLVIGQVKNPRSFANVTSLPVIHDAHPQAALTELRVTDWLRALDNHFQFQCRHVILFIDDCTAHPKDVELHNIKLVLLPSNAASRQPMNLGIIEVLKQGYKTRLTHRHHKDMEDVPGTKRPPTVHDAILYIAAAWEATKPETIQNCFEKAGFRNRKVDVIMEKETTILQYFPEHSSIDDNVRPCENSSGEDVITTKREVLSDDEDEEDPPPILSHAQALSAVHDLRRYVATLNTSEHAMQKLNYIENIIIVNVSKSFCQSKLVN